MVAQRLQRICLQCRRSVFGPLGQEDSLEKRNGETTPGILTLKIPWTKESEGCSPWNHESDMISDQKPQGL